MDIFDALIQMSNRHRHEYKLRLIAECISLECEIEHFKHTPDSFDLTYDILSVCAIDVLESMKDAYLFRIGNKQYEAERAPVRELNPHND
jgi:hypothetical protein